MVVQSQFLRILKQAARRGVGTILRNPADIEDVVEDACLRYFACVAQGRAPKKPAGFVFVTAYHLALKHRRLQLRTVVSAAERDESAGESQHVPPELIDRRDPQELVQLMEDGRQLFRLVHLVNEAVASLEPLDQELLLSVSRGAKFADLARERERTEGAIRKRYFRLLENLTAMIYFEAKADRPIAETFDRVLRTESDFHGSLLKLIRLISAVGLDGLAALVMRRS